MKSLLLENCTDDTQAPMPGSDVTQKQLVGPGANPDAGGFYLQSRNRAR